MTREIKFRAWFEPEQKICYMDNEIHISTFLGKYVTTNSKLMQYTGLKDRNGKEIYEEDIVKDWQHGGSSKVEWIRTSWQLVSPRNRWGAYCSRLNVLEVIGNIYENPELLK